MSETTALTYEIVVMVMVMGTDNIDLYHLGPHDILLLGNNDLLLDNNLVVISMMMVMVMASLLHNHCRRGLHAVLRNSVRRSIRSNGSAVDGLRGSVRRDLLGVRGRIGSTHGHEPRGVIPLSPAGSNF